MRIIEHSPTCLVLRQRLVGLRYVCAFCAALSLFLFLGYEFPLDSVGLVGLGTAGLGYQLTATEDCILDRQAGLLTLKNSLGRRFYPLGELQGVTVQKEVFWGTEFYRVYFLTQAGETIALTRFPTTQVQQQRNLARSIHQFMQGQSSQN